MLYKNIYLIIFKTFFTLERKGNFNVKLENFILVEAHKN